MKRINLFLFATLILLSSNTFSQKNSTGIFFSLEEALGSPNQVRTLKLNSVNKFIESNSEIKLPKLKVLMLSGIEGIELQKLLIAIDRSRELEEIYLSGCELNYLPHEIGNFTNLKIIDVSDNNIRTLPYEIEYLTNLKRVDVSNNNLVNLSNKIINWSNLTDLNIANNDSLQQGKVFLTLSFLSSLQHLTIGGLTKLEPNVADLQNIEHLTITESNFVSLPKEAIRLKNLKKLTIVNSSATQLIYLFAENNIQTLYLNNTPFNGGIEQITSLKELKINNCSSLNLTDLLSQLGNNKSIRSLSITSCGVEEIPSNIINLKSLERLDLTRNSIKEIPNEITSLKNLKTLNLKNNVINPKEITAIQNSNEQLNVYWDFYDEFIEDKEPATVNVKKVIAQPIEGIDVPNQAFKITTEEEITLSFKSGTSLEIPKNAFVDANGNVIAGEVDITFREFIDPVDFLVSGIPMGYDSAGVSYNFSSAGQIEFRASQNGQEVFPNSNSLI
ncbi:MAG: hypothetical protein JKX68_02135 [Flavobacteriales bacterium]|nr:hypothetical protein [Flavobacteriales bacterium]